MEIPKEIIELPYNQAIPLMSIYLIAMKSPSGEDTFTPTLTAALFTMARYGNNLDGHQSINVYMYNGILFSFLKKADPFICHIMNGSEGQYAR
jgi:hypothetical protein